MACLRWVFLLLLALGLSCANPPQLVKRTPGLRLLYRPGVMPYLGNQKFSFDMDTHWKGPESVEGGVRYTSEKGEGTITIVHLPKDSPLWKDPKDIRQYLTTQGSTEDSHVLTGLIISSRTAARASYTTYRYDPEYLLGTRAQAFYDEVVLIEDRDGLFLIRLHATKPAFRRLHKAYAAFLKSLILAAPAVEEQ
jgi:hypothetical protein